MLSEERRKELHKKLNTLSGRDNLSVEEMEAIADIRKGLDEEDESAGELKEWEDKYKKLEGDYKMALEDNIKITEAYRQRWNESTVGTKVNGKFVEKTVTDVSDYTYDNLLKGEK